MYVSMLQLYIYIYTYTYIYIYREREIIDIAGAGNTTSQRGF